MLPKTIPQGLKPISPPSDPLSGNLDPCRMFLSLHNLCDLSESMD